MQLQCLLECLDGTLAGTFRQRCPARSHQLSEIRILVPHLCGGAWDGTGSHGEEMSNQGKSQFSQKIGHFPVCDGCVRHGRKYQNLTVSRLGFSLGSTSQSLQARMENRS